MRAPQRISLGFSPHAYQRRIDAAMLLVRFFVAVCHRRFGKTEFALIKLLGSALRCSLPHGRYAYVAPHLNQAKDIAWTRLKEYARRIPNVTIHESELWIEFRNAGGHTSRIRLYGADNPDALRGRYLDGVVLDEVAQMHPDVWGVIIRPMLADRRGWALFIGTPQGVNIFKELFDYAATDPEWDRAVFRASETTLPWLPVSELESLRRELGEEMYRQEFECDFTANAFNLVCPLEWAETAAGRVIKHESELYGYEKVVGVDVARFGHHRSAICRRWGPAYYPIQWWRGMDTMTLASQCAMVWHEWKPDAMFVDVGGVGAGVVDRLNHLGIPAIGVAFGATQGVPPQFKNKRTQMWMTLAYHLRDVGVLLGSTKEISEFKTDVCSLTYRHVGDKRELESKEGDPEQNKHRARPLKSPDLGDAAALTHAEKVIPKHEGYRQMQDLAAAGGGSMKDWKPGWQ